VGVAGAGSVATTTPSATDQLSSTTGPVEGRVHRITMIKRQLYGRANFDLLRKRVLLMTGVAITESGPEPVFAVADRPAPIAPISNGSTPSRQPSVGATKMSGS
jgi:hypothetical protein